MDIDEFRQLFNKAPDKFPTGLESRYPRLLAQILAKWDYPREFEAYVNELVVDQRGTRQGFPQEILREILFVAALFEKWRAERKRKASPSALMALSPTLVDGLDKAQKTLTPELIRSLTQMKIKMQRDDTSGLADVVPVINQRDKDGMTLLMHAASFGAEKCLLMLLQAGANPHMADPGGNRSLHWAVTMNRLRAAEILMYFGADPNARNAMGIVPMSLAAIKPDPALASRLNDYGADLNQPDGRGDFPLHKAVMAGAADSVRFLLAGGASKEMKNREGKTPLELNHSQHAAAVTQAFQDHQNDLMRGSMYK